MATTTTKLRNMVVLLAIAATLVTAPTLILSPQLAQAQSGKFIDGRGTGELRCPSAEGEPGASPPVEASIFLSAGKFRGFVSGNWGISTDFGSKGFSIFGGKISGNEFTLRGLEQDDSICLISPTATITITGQCGTNVPIQFRSSNGEEGEFVGNVGCVK